MSKQEESAIIVLACLAGAIAVLSVALLVRVLGF
jgi:hypothetical protein